MIFSLRQLKEKCGEHQMPLYVAFIDLTKAFDLVSRDGLFKAIKKIGCPPRLCSLIKPFHSNMKGTVQFNSNLSEPFDVRGRVKQGCVLAPTLFEIFISLLLRHAEAKTKVHEAVIRDMLFADDAPVMTHAQWELQLLMDRFSQACKDFGLTISLKRTNVLGQDAPAQTVITIDDYELGAVHSFVYIGSQFLATYPSMLRSTGGLERQLQHSLASHQECGQAPS